MFEEELFSDELKYCLTLMLMDMMDLRSFRVCHPSVLRVSPWFLCLLLHKCEEGCHCAVDEVTNAMDTVFFVREIRCHGVDFVCNVFRGKGICLVRHQKVRSGWEGEWETKKMEIWGWRLTWAPCCLLSYAYFKALCLPDAKCHF